MEKEQIRAIVAKQREFFGKETTLSVHTRVKALEKLRRWIQENERLILDALHKDLNKSDFEGYMTEIGMVLDELRFIIRHLPGWARIKRVKTPLAQFIAKSYVLQEPYGTVLIMSPWNYPFQLSIEPLAGALAAGNTAVLKPSAYSPATSAIISKMIHECFDPGWVEVIEGGRSENMALLDERFDYIFFTGSAEVGKMVMEKASRYLCPVSLELGGKSPVIVDKTANIRLTAKRLAFGKFLNAGQTCVAPDHVYVHQDVKAALMGELKKAIGELYPGDQLKNAAFPHIVNKKHFHRLLNLIQDEHIILGGRYDEPQLIIEPTIVDDITLDSPLMEEEIFGPILPVMTYADLEEVIAAIISRPKPLALYLFAGDKAVEKRVLGKVSFGGGCVNDTIIHLATSHMGFGGAGDSGMGSYHGKKSFETFSHSKGIVNKSTLIDLPMRYTPYTETNFKLLKMFLK